MKLRLMWAIKTLLPPVKAAWRYLNNRQFSFKARITAVWVESLLWLLGILEMLRLFVTNKQPERR